MKESLIEHYLKKIANFLHWQRNPKPEVDLSSEIWGELRPFRIPIILTILIMLFGTLGYIWIDNFSLLDAIYQTGITFTTVGFGEIAPISPLGRLFTIFLIVAGFAVFSYAVGILVDVINKSKKLKGKILTIGITNQRETTILWDKITGKPVYNAIVWQDRRTSDFCEKLRKRKKNLQQLRGGT